MFIPLSLFVKDRLCSGGFKQIIHCVTWWEPLFLKWLDPVAVAVTVKLCQNTDILLVLPSSGPSSAYVANIWARSVCHDVIDHAACIYIYIYIYICSDCCPLKSCRRSAMEKNHNCLFLWVFFLRQLYIIDDDFFSFIEQRSHEFVYSHVQKKYIQPADHKR